MAVRHAQPLESIDIRPFGSQLSRQQTTTLFRGDSLEVIRLIAPAGREIATHSAPDEMTAQCLEGRVVLTTPLESRELTPGTMLYLRAREPHSLKALEDSSLLLTLVVKRPGSD
ncbi:MAG: cupin domain-containing protein [Planctomycetaceae bacterium]